MRADESVMVLGEDVGRAGGVFRVTQGLHGRVRGCEGHGHASGGEPDRGLRHRPLGQRDAPRGRDTVRRLHPAGFRPDRQRGGQVLLPLERRLELPHDHPRPIRRRARRRPLPLPEHRGLVLQHAGPQGRRAHVPGRRQGHDQELHPRPQPRPLPRTQTHLPPHKGGGPRQTTTRSPSARPASTAKARISRSSPTA